MTTPANNKSSTTVTMENRQYRYLVIGKTGNGKSTVGNVLLGRDVFPVGRSMASTTLKAQRQASVSSKGDQIVVVDTPDPVNWDGLIKPNLADEVRHWITMTSPGPSAILLTIRCDVRYTAEEYDVYKRIKAALEDSSFTERLVVAFTFGDRQDRDIEQELRDVCPELKSVLRDAKKRYVVFNGQAYDRDQQLEKLQRFVRQMDLEPPVPHWYRAAQKLLAVLVLVFGLLWLIYSFFTSTHKEPGATHDKPHVSEQEEPPAPFGELCVVFIVVAIVSEVGKKRIVTVVQTIIFKVRALRQPHLY